MQPFSATQAALAEASQTAAEAAQLAMQNAYAQAFKAKLDVTMKVRSAAVRERCCVTWGEDISIRYMRPSVSVMLHIGYYTLIWLAVFFCRMFSGTR